MLDAKPVNVRLRDHFKLSKAPTPMTEDEKTHIEGDICISCKQLDICYGLYETKHYSSSGSCQQVYEQSQIPRKDYWRAVKWILKYLKGSSDMALCYDGKGLRLHRYVDSDFAGDVDSRKSTTSYVFTLKSVAVSWVSRLQKIVALSTTEAKYVAMNKLARS